jgi:hypothetical protein
MKNNSRKLRNFETETEPETEIDILASISKQKEEILKTKAKGSANEKKSSNFWKRFIVSIFIFSWYLIPIQMGAPYWVINQNLISAMMFNEFMMLARDSRKDTYLQFIIEWAIYLLIWYKNAARSLFTKTILIKSGLNKKDYPLLHYVCYDFRNLISLFFCILITIIFLLSLKR